MAVDSYHEGERTAQRRAGLGDQGEFSARAIRAEIPEVARKFLLQQPMVVLGAADGRGRMWATLLTGPPGFLRAEDARTIAVDARPAPGDPLHDRLTAPARVGMLAIEPSRHRRMRMNGHAVPTGRGLSVTLDQVYSNCPKYIQKRAPQWEPAAPAPPKRSRALTGDQRRWITGADTFFIATSDLDGDADASHRGGGPGFVEVVSPTVLRWPDYVGNAMFNTLGNLEVQPRAGLLFPDWRTGDALYLTGTARTDWDPVHAAAVPGAERLVEFTATDVVEITGALPLRWSDPVPSRFNPPVRPPGEAR
ncbi:pyridoxamine 5'-phosphate oxidase family protein [Actinomadura sp. 6K520]|uniref:pyridoxamine 5'-phosphate oxidase family protein n=1 Tax=Actinomadura sp. 6K520 TaxID=2530364 RepID=UPI001049A4B0|nr:pyridoxamine 5'-phosphate oxidase family protein [Actinomadura sp. 6K520]TDE36911.1 pyridoxamine 5'-phosphate oxidase family protein [Actinomadura sp. 6K520]